MKILGIAGNTESYERWKKVVLQVPETHVIYQSSIYQELCAPDNATPASGISQQ
jgi:hypothetical protein